VTTQPTLAPGAFEKRVSKAAGGDGFADVWKRDSFAREYKGRNKDLRAAYVQGTRALFHSEEPFTKARIKDNLRKAERAELSGGMS